MLFLLILTSCKQQKQEVNISFSAEEIVIPAIEKNKKDVSFKLKNGILYFDIKPFSGIVKEFYSEKKLKSTSEYYQGKKQGVFKAWYVNGNKWFQRFYTNGLKSGVHIGWFDNGKPMFKYHFNTKGVYNGRVSEWYKNGMLLKEFHFIEGKEEGSQKMWQPSGKIRANFVTKKGERFGLIGLKKCYSIPTENEEIK